MTNYTAGRGLEYKLKKELEKQGLFVVRSAGSHGPFDLIAVDFQKGQVHFIQIKKSKSPDSEKLHFLHNLPGPALRHNHFYFDLYIRKKRKWEIFSV